MKCKDLLGALSEYLDEDAKRELCAEIERHLAKCPSCKVEVDTMTRTVSLMRHLGEGRLREEVVIRLRTRICTRHD
ncbi:MAG: zf-HC2 domain-containing protein [Candidatus Eisenbacteria bacterium]|uniref:Zf-HC2 domain-containing protein n=1 Tax=Eiseniibacteriota bacterium TaxID=2212470 RepID=A0A956M3M1_UNCEI|nr:zf-HC2 domain-containing protein [Candidatus Eisenbacteria bacterium]